MKHFLAILFAVLAGASARADLFINELDYDNVGTDSNEWVEIVGTTGTSLNGYELVMIDQNGVVQNTFDLTGASFTFSDETGTGWGFFIIGELDPGYGVSPDYTPAGWTQDEIQNGGTDSIQLRLTAGPVNVHFLDYEGDNPNTSSDQISTAGDSGAPASSLYLTGSGNSFSALTWDGTTGNGTPGALNVGQTLTVIPEPATISFMGVGLAAMLWRRRRLATDSKA
jgi:hypothetical protein